MSIPTHNLYDFVHQATKRQFWLMYFYPWGSKDLSNVIDYQLDNNKLNSDIRGIPDHCRIDLAKYDINSLTQQNLPHYFVKETQPILFCYDQEPLFFDLYKEGSLIVENYISNYSSFPYDKKYFPHKNLGFKLLFPYSIQKKFILLHSELNSNELEKFENTNLLVGAYWWSHAIIARDWYRYAEHDLELNYNNYSKLFLTYCRDTSGSRTYRKNFLEMSKDLHEHCLFSSKNLDDITPDLSAGYNSEDISSTAISVVLETVFDQRIHLTEKTLRPIACGHPFILAAGPGSLSLLKNYGFKTFHPFIDESYDSIENDNDRLRFIVNEMRRIKNLKKSNLDYLITKCKQIADHNKKIFFSYEFLLKIANELKNNVDRAYQQLPKDYDTDIWWYERQRVKQMGYKFKKDLTRQALIKIRWEQRKKKRNKF